MKRILAFTMILTLLLSACGNTVTTETEQSDTTSPEQTPVETEITRATTPDSLPATMDFAGESMRIIHGNSDEHNNEFYVEEDTGEALTSALFARQTAVEERLNVKIVDIIHSEDAALAAQTAVTAGVDDYDIIAGAQWQMMKQSTIRRTGRGRHDEGRPASVLTLPSQHFHLFPGHGK